MVFWTCEQDDEDVIHGKGRREEIDTRKVLKYFEDKAQMLIERDGSERDSRLDKMFGIAEKVFYYLTPEIFETEANASTYADLLKLLHVYILPEVIFTRKHRKFVQHALEKIEKECGKIEMLIEMNVQLHKKHEESLAKERKELLTEVGASDILKAMSRDKGFIVLLLKHIEKDIRKHEVNLALLSDKIPEMKGKTDEPDIFTDTSAELNAVLEEKLKLRAVGEELFQGASQSQEKFDCYTEESVTSQHHPERTRRLSERLERYEKIATDLESLSNDVKKQIKIKIRLSSAREAACLTLKQIEVDGTSFACYINNRLSSDTEAGVTDLTKHPDVAKQPNEDVSVFAKFNQPDFRIKHEKFCTRLKLKCKTLQNNTEGTSDSFRCGRLDFPIMRNQPAQKKTMRYSTRWLFGSVPKEDCENICKEISEHITILSEEIAREISGEGDKQPILKTKVHICYAEYVSEELMPVLCELYEQSFRTQCNRLSNWIERYAATELDSINNTFKGLISAECSVEMLVERFDEMSNSWSESFEHAWNFLISRERGTFTDMMAKNDVQSSRKRFISVFQKTFSAIQEEDSAMSLFSKLSHLTRAVKLAEETFSDLLIGNGQSDDISTEDTLDILMLLLCRIDSDSLHKLYAHVNLILHLSPFFIQGNEYPLVLLTEAYQHLFERQEMHGMSMQKL